MKQFALLFSICLAGLFLSQCGDTNLSGNSNAGISGTIQGAANMRVFLDRATVTKANEIVSGTDETLEVIGDWHSWCDRLYVLRDFEDPDGYWYWQTVTKD